MNKKEKLLNRPVEDDTTILNSSLVMFKECIGLMELWRWEGITGQSIVLLVEDFKNKNKDEIISTIFSELKSRSILKPPIKKREITSLSILISPPKGASLQFQRNL